MKQINLLETLVSGGEIKREDLSSFLAGVIDGKVNDIYAGAVLAVLSSKINETVLFNMVDSLYTLCKCNFVSDAAIDTCGTGGSGIPKLNISSAVALLCRAAGIRIAKHGNRSASGKVGSADVFFGVGWPKNLAIDEYIKIYEKVGFCFLFAPHFFPALAKFANVRKALGIRTVFNFAGPLCNPFRVGWQMIGVSDSKIMEQYAKVLLSLGREGVVLSSESGLDEADIFSSVRLVWIRRGRILDEVISFNEIMGADIVSRIRKDDILCVDLHDAIDKFELLMDGKGSDSFKLIVAFNAAIVLFAKNKVDDIGSGIEMAMDLINSGKLRQIWQEVLNGIDSLRG